MNLIFYRRLVQIFTVLGLMFVSFSSLFRLDIPSKAFIVMGQRLFLKETYIVIIGLLIFLFLLFGLIKLFGRVPCGWVCPRNTFTEIVDFFMKRKGSAAWLWKGIGVIVVLALAYLVGIVTMAFFFDWRLILSDTLAMNFSVASVLTAAFSLFVFVDMLFIRHVFCKSACPYGMMQNIFSDEKTMKINFDNESCIHCNACVRSCFLGIDPKTEALDSCVACGDCTVACNQIFVKAKKTPPPSLAFHFGASGENFSFGQLLIDKRLIFLVVIVLALSSIMGYAFTNHKDIMVAILQSKYSKPEVIDRVNGVYTKNYMLNMSSSAKVDKKITLKVANLPESFVTITPNNFIIQAGKTVDIPMTITVHKGELEANKAYPFTLEILDENGEIIQEADNQFFMLQL